MTLPNAEIAGILTQHADLMEIAGENRFRINAYRRAARAVKSHDRAVGDEPDLTAIDGVGAGISAVIQEILATGAYGEFEELQESLPGSLLTMMDIPGLGAKRVHRFYQELSITSVAELEEAARAEKLRSLKGIGPKAEQQILEGIAFLRTRSDNYSIGLGLPLAERLRDAIETATGARTEIAGSVRRMAETVGDINILVVSDQAGSVFGAIERLADVAGVNEQQEATSTYRLHPGPHLQVTVATPDRAGSAWIEATGSAEHLRELTAGRPLPAAVTEQECYAAFGLPWIAPGAARESRGARGRGGEALA